MKLILCVVVMVMVASVGWAGVNCPTYDPIAKRTYADIAKEVADNLYSKQPEYILVKQEDIDNIAHCKVQLLEDIKSGTKLAQYIIAVDTMRFNSKKIKEKLELERQISYLEDKISILEMKINYLQSQLNEFKEQK